MLAGIAPAAPRLPALKIDTVVIRGINDDELVPLIERAGSGAEVRFIEYMDVGGATHWSMDARRFARARCSRARRALRPIDPIRGQGSAPADRFRCRTAPCSASSPRRRRPFCRSCDRSRLTADGHWYLCLYAPLGTDLRGPLRAGASEEALRELLTSTWRRRDDRGAEQRLGIVERAPLLPRAELARDPHLEMHTRGG